MKIQPSEAFKQFRRAGIGFFTGVPDSLLKSFCAYASDELNADEHIIAANEGSSIAIASGHYLATGSPSLVYMQNSGIGNAVNPLLSLASSPNLRSKLLSFANALLITFASNSSISVNESFLPKVI